MKISIAVPSYNYGRYLVGCLEAIRRQDHDDFEVLIADGGSNDDSLAIVERYCRDDARFRLVSTRDRGQGDALVKAFEHATGDVFCFLNADDTFLCDDAFSAAVDALRRHPGVDVVTFGGYYVDEHGRHTRPVRLRYHPLDHLGLMKYRTCALQPATFWTRRVARDIPIRPEFDYSFDTVFFWEAFQRYSWLELPKPVAGYRLHGDNKSMQIVPRRVHELARFESMKFGERSLRAGYLRCVGGLVAMLAHVPGLGGPLRRAVRLAVNSLAYATAYRLPGI
jgi:glycosyltransferase involved in cell wall biosynthesis